MKGRAMNDLKATVLWFFISFLVFRVGIIWCNSLPDNKYDYGILKKNQERLGIIIIASFVSVVIAFYYLSSWIFS
jgi:hypothetical protein